VGELTIGETYFFRQIEHFELLRSTIFPDLLQQNEARRQLRIWSAGCATGAEPYSVAVLLYTEFAARIHDWNISILGTDINEAFLAQARTGQFSEWTLRDVPTDMRNRCFRQDGKRWILNTQFRDAVTFRYQNLADDVKSPLDDDGPFDLILCRNVMIYFSHERNRAVAAGFFRQLSEGGWLLVGHAESSIEMFQQFKPVSVGTATGYTKSRNGADQLPPAAAIWVPWLDYGSTYEETVAATSAEHLPAFAPSTQTSSPSKTLEDARMLADCGLWSDAEEICRKVLDHSPLDAPAHLTLGLILSHVGSPDAIRELRRAIYIDRRLALAYYYLGTLLQKSGPTSDARRAFRNSLALLEERPSDEIVEYGDGITVGELKELARMHQEVLKG
jgi:chemotaxis protein methyltransferase CheR